MNNKCNSPEIGKYLHAYELGILPEEKRTAFEEHLLSCSFCFNEVEAMHQPLEIIESKIDMEMIKKSASAHPEKQSSIIQNLSEWIKSGWAKPAILVVLIMLLVYPVYLGLIEKRQSADITSVQSLSLFSHRGEADTPFDYNQNRDLVLSFICPDIDQSRQYTVTIKSCEDTELISFPAFDGFDAYNTGHIKIPKELLSNGNYSVEVIGPETDTLYHFTFNLKAQVQQ